MVILKNEKQLIVDRNVLGIQMLGTACSSFCSKSEFWFQYLLTVSMVENITAPRETEREEGGEGGTESE